MSPTAELDYRPDIDGLRAIAVLAVIGYHAGSHRMPGGFVGVDVFFVISGYLISGIIFRGLQRGNFSFADFYARRVRRIAPSLAVVLVVSWLIGWFVLSPEEYSQLGKHIAAGAGFIPNFVSWREAGYFDVAAEFKPLLHLWSLGVEEQFYVVWPLLLLLVWKRGSNTLLIMSALTLVSFVLNVWQIKTNAVATFYLPVTRLWELALGGCLSYVMLFRVEQHDRFLNRFIFTSTSSRSACNFLAGSGFLLLMFAIVYLDKGKAFPGWWAVMPTIAAILLIAAGPNTWVNRKILANRALVYIGLISYPLYLWHWILFSFARIAMFSSKQTIYAAVGLSFLLSWLTYSFIERPIRFGPKSYQRMVTGSLLALTLLAGTAGLMTYEKDGFPGHWPKELQSLTLYKNSFPDSRCYVTPTSEVIIPIADCVGRDRKKIGSPLVVLWGDSHAAHLYAGLADEQRNTGFRLGTFTATACPPVLDLEISTRPYCRSLNEATMDAIRKFQPATVIMSANWSWYAGDNVIHPGEFADELRQTIDSLKAVGVKQIVLVGPVPQWGEGGLPSAMRKYYFRYGAVPLRTNYALATFEQTQTLDRQLQKASTELQIDYVSPLNIFCNFDGCVTRTGDEAGSVVAYDGSHLTAAGSSYLMHRAMQQLTMALPGVPAEQKPLSRSPAAKNR